MALGIGGVALQARAEPTELQLETARANFSEGLRLEEYRDFVGALERFDLVASVKTTPQVRFHRALCLEKLGRWVEASEEFARARDEALGFGEELQRVRLASQAHVNWLNSQLPTLTLGLDPPEARIMVDARVLPVARGVGPFPLDPGPHVLRATAPGHAELVERLDIKPGQSLHARVVLQRLAAQPDAVPERSRVLLYVGGGVAVASLVGAGVTLGLRSSAMNELDAQCGAMRQRCPESARTLEGRGATLNTLSNVLIGVGVSASIVTIGAWWLGRSRGPDGAPPSPTSSLRISLWSPPGVRGTW